MIRSCRWLCNFGPHIRQSLEVFVKCFNRILVVYAFGAKILKVDKVAYQFVAAANDEVTPAIFALSQNAVIFICCDDEAMKTFDIKRILPFFVNCECWGVNERFHLLLK